MKSKEALQYVSNSSNKIHVNLNSTQFSETKKIGVKLNKPH